MPISPAEADGTARRTSPSLVVDSVVAGYSTTTAPVLNGLSLTAARGEVVSIIGPNGAGKSTLLKAVIGAVRVTSGSISLNGQDVTNIRGDRLVRLGLGYVPQVMDVFDLLTVQENLEMGGYLLPKREVAARVDHVISIFPKLAAMRGRAARKLSGGERKMVAIARALMLEPTMLILDEPTAGLSAALSSHLLSDHIRRLVEAGKGVVLIEQKAVEALEISDWAYVLVGGSVQISASAKEILSRPDIGEVFLGRPVNTIT